MSYLTETERYESVKQKHVCFNYLSYEHDVRSCPSKKTCKECWRKHYSMLHHLDYAGSLVKHGNPRKPTLEKRYVTVFVCMCTRAVHLGLVSSLSSEAFISVFRRIVNRRGLPTTVYSNHSTNFVGVNWEIQAAIMIHCFTEPRKMKWKFSPVQSPHMAVSGKLVYSKLKELSLKLSAITS